MLVPAISKRPFEAEFSSMNAMATRLQQLHTYQYHPPNNGDLRLPLKNFPLGLASGPNPNPVMYTEAGKPGRGEWAPYYAECFQI